VVPGGASPKDYDGKFLHEDVWRYLFTQPVEEVGADTPADESCKKNLVP
jgi:hypothetical protein